MSGRVHGLDEAAVADRRVLVRADLNVPLSDGHVEDATRITRLAPTIRELAEKGAKVIICSHFGRPKGKRRPEMSLAPVAPALAAELGRPVDFCPECSGAPVAPAGARLARGGGLVLEAGGF